LNAGSERTLTSRASLLLMAKQFGNKISSDKTRGFKFCLLYVDSERTNVIEICAILGLYAAQNGSLLPMFRFNLSVPISKVKQFLTYSYFCTNV
jgi:hypothetical protein